MDAIAANEFAKACQDLERISELKEKNLLEEVEYQELRRKLVAQMHIALTPKDRQTELDWGKDSTLTYSVAYGGAHAKIVATLVSGHKSGEDNPKEPLLRALSKLAGRGALYSADVADLQEMIDVLCTPLDEELVLNDAKSPEIMLSAVKKVNDISMQVTDRQNSSETAKAIAQTVQQSASKAVDKFEDERKGQTKPWCARPIKDFWLKFVVKDAKGAFEGGVAALEAHEQMAMLLPLALPIAAAFGAVVGAGVESAAAYFDE
jgi:hypothetical protein